MAENKKELERAELHRTIWAIADEMRGAVDGWDFKAYILGMLFYRYISENITNISIATIASYRGLCVALTVFLPSI